MTDKQILRLVARLDKKIYEGRLLLDKIKQADHPMASEIYERISAEGVYLICDLVSSVEDLLEERP